jgi:hypothetical protein
MKVLHVTRCLAAPRAYGGYNRSRQILEALSLHAVDCIPVDLFAPDFGGRTGNLRAGLALAWQRGFPAPRTYARLWIAGHYHRLLAAAVARQPAVHPVLIWENTQDDLLAYAAARLGLRVVALPHDLVALNRPAGPDTWPALAREVRGLAGCNGLFTISLEERWLLRLLGCAAECLPYYPPAEIESLLLQVRQQRRPAVNAPVLILGSTSNPQTRAGLAHQLQLLRDAGSALGRRIVLAGNGTSDLAELAGPGVEVRGTVGDGELSTLMAEAAVLWAYQAAGTGALTRVVEALVAGLPVAGGGVALRSTGHLSHVYPAGTVAELMALLPSLPAVAARPARPLQAERDFAGGVKALA